MDIILGLSKLLGGWILSVVVNRFSIMDHFISWQETTIASHIVKLYFGHLFVCMAYLGPLF